jgi:hypothetical protein
MNVRHVAVMDQEVRKVAPILGVSSSGRIDFHPSATAAQRAAAAALVSEWRDEDWDYVEQRRLAYPPVGDQLDAIWKGGAEMEAMRAVVMAVKVKYPKPVKV